MAFLDEDGVETLSGQIRTLADATYAPLDHIHSEANGTSIVSQSITASTSAWVGSTQSFTITERMLVYIYCGVRVAGVGLDEATGQTRPRTFLYESDHARRSPIYFLPAGTYYPYVKGTSAGSVTVSVYEVHIA